MPKRSPSAADSWPVVLGKWRRIGSSRALAQVGKQAPPARRSAAPWAASRATRGALLFAYMRVLSVKHRRDALEQFLWSITMTVPSARPEFEPSSARSTGQGRRSRRRRRLGLDRASTQLCWFSADHLSFPQDMDLDTCHAARRISLHPVGSHSSRTNIPLHERLRSRKGGTHLPGGMLPCEQPVTRPSRRSGISLRSNPENGSSRDHAGLEVPPKRDDQFPRDGDDRDFPYPTLQCADPLAEPSRQPTFGLMPQP